MLSSPNRLGRGMTQWKPRSARPRTQTTRNSEAVSDQYHAQPCVWLSQTKTAGAVSRATKVAARVSLRH